MRKLIAILSILSSVFILKAQSQTIDSLQRVLKITTVDTTRVFTLLRICLEYYYVVPDSAMLFAQQAYHLAEEKEFPLGAAQSLAIIGDLFFEKGNYVKALETHVKALEIYERIKSPLGMAACYNNMAMVYQEQEDDRNAVRYYLKAKDIFQAKNKKDDLVKTFINLGFNYEKMNLLDSALFYQNKAYELGLQVKNTGDIAAALVNLGDIHHRLHQDEVALDHYRRSIPLALQENDKQLQAKAKYGIARIYKDADATDSAILYAKQSLASAVDCSFSKGVVNAADLLSHLYESQNRMDSAYWYFKKSVSTKDTLFNSEIVRKVQIINQNEQLREQEKRAALQRYRNNLIKYAILGGVLILLIATGFWLRVNQLKREQMIRTKLSKDLHDDLGSTLNSIKVYTNLALIKKEDVHLLKIKESTQEAISGVRDIMWVLDDRKDVISDLLQRIRQFAVPLCEANDIKYIQQIPEEVLYYKLDQEEKRSLYLIVKEAINNTVKYAKASEVHLTMELYLKGKLCIQIKDNGQGFDVTEPGEGNGLKNMKYRAERIGYYFNINAVIGQGTIIELKKH
ncbi:tetratricopeptide repeat protein [Chitinophagaceae bacterium LB-8]|uniref:histidine kinase n=1 Tax=Paraflavisolibacter caeni TaxID=2982496 RepID=A0A9X2XVU6_9BACT|nr:tetratricopeptide repeat-containing sensor histidine kinase [Paraflavisolibacter caeni]MCU7549960.1 tetratricopeptide repeat protein [Paraflavisolibacter caeni]